MQSLDLKALIFKIWSLINISFSMLSNAWYMKKSVNKTSTLFQAGLPEIKNKSLLKTKHFQEGLILSKL
jgi:hypothetical protein